MQLFDSVRVLVDIPALGIQAGMYGAIVEIMTKHKDFLVEVFEDDKTVGVGEFTIEQLELVLPYIAEGELVVLIEDTEYYPAKRVGRVVKRLDMGQRLAVTFAVQSHDDTPQVELPIAQVRRLTAADTVIVENAAIQS